MTGTIIIPARWGSSRFPGKPLHKFAGRTLIEHTWRAACRAGLPVHIATDDGRIANVAAAFGADVVMTGECRNGTERCAEAAARLKINGPVINWQGDSPLVPPGWISHLLYALDDAEVATPIQRCSPEQASRLKHEAAMGRPGGTCAVTDGELRALYFSKAIIPPRGPLWFHVGVYAYRAAALAAYGREEGMIERMEQLEQLRFLECGLTVQCVPVDGPPIWEVNNPDDVYRVEELMSGSVRA